LNQFQNLVSAKLRFDGLALGKSGGITAFSSQFKVAVPKSDILKQPQLIGLKSSFKNFIMKAIKGAAPTLCGCFQTPKQTPPRN
jgi:hypothetical protein